MDNDQKFWLGMWKVIGGSVVAVFLIGASSCQLTNYRIQQAIASGADPLEARCALEAEPTRACFVPVSKAD